MHLDDAREWKRDDDFPLSLVFNRSEYRYADPFYFGVNEDSALVFMFRPQDEIRLSQSPSGGGVGNPAWDFHDDSAVRSRASLPDGDASSGGPLRDSESAGFGPRPIAKPLSPTSWRRVSGTAGLPDDTRSSAKVVSKGLWSGVIEELDDSRTRCF